MSDIQNMMLDIKRNINYLNELNFDNWLAFCKSGKAAG